MITATTATPEALAGKYLTFCLAEETYAVRIERVREILRPLPVTPVPKTPEHVLGVLNLRGRVLPVTDLRRLFGQEPVEQSERSCLVVIEVSVGNSDERHMLALLVDSVKDVLDLPGSSIQPAASLGSSLGKSAVLALATIQDNVYNLLDTDTLFSDEAMLNAPELAGDVEEAGPVETVEP